jgi:DNA replication and repair protein RecF
VLVSRLWLTDFRNYTTAETALAPGLTVVIGGNGEGKTSLLEAVGYLAALSSFRGAPTEALVRQGCERAVVRAEGMRGRRELLLEAEVPVTGRARVALNRQPLKRLGPCG